MIVLGVDAHKRTHRLVALDAVTGASRGQRTVAATDDGTLDGLRFAVELDPERAWAIEDCRYVSARLERALLAAGERVIRVAVADRRVAQRITGTREVRSDRRDRGRAGGGPRRP